jgi:hypothetical protein
MPCPRVVSEPASLALAFTLNRPKPRSMLKRKRHMTKLLTALTFAAFAAFSLNATAASHAAAAPAKASAPMAKASAPMAKASAPAKMEEKKK